MKSVVSKKAFTIVELLVAMGLVVILVALSSLIFAAGVKAHRLADSTIEITRRAEAVSRQLVADVGGLRTDAPLAIWFENAFVDTTGDGVADTYRRFDQILFFANGDFQTIKQYNGNTVWGNVSRIYYGHAWGGRVNSGSEPWMWAIRDDGGYRWFSQTDPGARLLSRRVQLLTSDMTLPPMTMIGHRFPNPNSFTSILGNYSQGQFVPYWNNRLEYDQLSLAEWKNLMQDFQNCEQVLLRGFSNQRDAAIAGRPMIDMTNIDTLHLLLSEQISEFKVQWAYAADDLSINESTYVPVLPADYFNDLRWWPSENPAGNGTVESDFATMMAGLFGAYFNLPGGTTLADWHRTKPNPAETPEQQASRRCRTRGQSGTYYYFSQTYFPRALKVTFTVHDAKGLFPEGKTFTQIVKIDN